MRFARRLASVFVFLTLATATGCSFFDDEIGYNPNVRNGTDPTVLKELDRIMSRPFDAMDFFDRRFENSVY